MVGIQIKELRKQQSITLKQLSEKTLLSVGYLSNIERSLTSPTLENLGTIAKALGVSLQRLILEQPSENILVRKGDRALIYNIPERLRWEALTDGQRSLRAICTTHYNNVEDEISWGHNYDELAIVIKGALAIALGDTWYELQEGDTLFVEKHTSHRAHKISDCECVVYWILNGDNSKL